MLFTFRTAGALGFCCPSFYTPFAPLVLKDDGLKPRRGERCIGSVNTVNNKPQRGERCQTPHTKLTPMVRLGNRTYRSVQIIIGFTINNLMLCQHIIIGRDSEIAPTAGTFRVGGNSDSRLLSRPIN